MERIKYLIFLVLLMGCNNIPKTNVLTLNDNDVYTIIKYENMDYRIFGDYEGIELSQEDLMIINNILVKSIDEYNTNLEINFNKALDYLKEHYNDSNKQIYDRMVNFDIGNSFINLKNYKRQYVAVINKDNEKIIWVNCFNINSSFTFDYWKEQIVQVLDGGDNFFNLKINITKKYYYDFLVNGIG